MLEELRQSYEDYADSCVPGWRSLSKNDLCRLYSANRGNEQLENGYFAAIVCKYWNKLYKYQQMSPGFAPQDFYDWYIFGLRNILGRCPWDNPESPLYGDPRGPDKAVNRSLKTARLVFYEKTNTYKRRANIGAASIEDLEEKYHDATFPEALSLNNLDISDTVYTMVSDYFSRKDYFMAFMIFNIVAREPFELTQKDGVDYLAYNEKKLIRYMHNINPDFCQIMAGELDLNLEEVLFAASTCTSLSLYRIKAAIRRNLKILGNSKYFKIEE